MDDWCVIMDGDGCFYVNFQFNKTLAGKKYIDFRPGFTLSMEVEAKLTLKTFLFMVGCEGSIPYVHLNDGEPKAISYSITSEKNLLKVIGFFNKAVPINQVKVKQLDLVNHYFDLKKKKKLTNVDEICKFIKKCYEVNDLGKAKGKLRLSSVDECLKKVYDWFKSET
jgi:hypothetical protein